MSKANLRFITDVFLFACLGGMTVIGALMWFVIPKGPASPEASKYIWGLHRHQWGAIHAYLSAAFVVFLILHVILNWGWIVTRMRQLFRGAAVPASVLLAASPFIVLAGFWIATPKADPAAALREPGRSQPVHGTAADNAADALRSTTAAAEPQASAQPSGVAPKEGGEHERRGETVAVTGRTTLEEIAKTTGLSIEAICERAGLPSDLPPRTELGRLRRLHGFQIQTLRDAVASLLKGR